MKQKIFLAIIVTSILLGITATATKASTRDELHQIEIQTRDQKIDLIQDRLEKNKKTEQDTKEQLDKKIKENSELQKQIEALQAKKAEEERLASTQSKSIADRLLNTQTAYASGGDKDSWLLASGIPQSEWGYVDWLVTRESGWNPCAYNPGQSDCNANPSSACGLVQQYPCGKIEGSWTDPVAALRWQYNYVNARYGGYAQAVAYWQANGSY